MLWRCWGYGCSAVVHSEALSEGAAEGGRASGRPVKVERVERSDSVRRWEVVVEDMVGMLVLAGRTGLWLVG